MFQQIPCTIELSEKFGRDRPEFSLSIRFEAEQRLPLTKLELYLYQTTKAEYYFGLKVQKVIQNELFVTAIGEFDEEEFKEGFKIFDKIVKLLEDRKRHMIIGDQKYTDALIPLIEELKYTYVCYPTINYFMTPEQEKLLMKSPELPLPEGYELGLSTIDDAKVITDCWIHGKGKPGEEEQTKMKVSVFPSVCIRHNGELVACELVHASGMLNHLYVFPEHRKNGLGLIVQQDMMRRLIKENHYVFKTVETYNKSVIQHTDESPFWTKRVNPDGSANIRMYMVILPVELSDQK